RPMPPVSRAARSVALVQFPQHNVFARQRISLRGAARAARNLILRSALSTYDLVVCNSDFVRRHTEVYFGRRDALVIYPPVDEAIACSPKDSSILSVARFFDMKRQDALIEAFRRLRERLPADSAWTLHLAGGHDEDSRA